MENHSKENGIDGVLNNCTFNNYHPERNGEADMKNRRDTSKSYKISQDLVLDNELVNDASNKEMSNTFKEIIENSSKLKDTPNKLDIVKNGNDEMNSPDSDDLFDSCKVSSLNHNIVVHNVYREESSNNNTNISNQPNVIQQSVSTNHQLNDMNNGNLSDMVQKVNSLNSNTSPKVVFHTPHTTPLKLKLNSLPVQSHPLEQDDLDYRNEPLEFPNSPVLNKTIDEMCLRRYKRTSGVAVSPNPLCESVGESPISKQDTEMNCIRTSPPSVPVPGTTAPDFTNNVSAASYLKKYDDINAQVRAYLNKTSAGGKSELDALNERTHRYLNPHADGSISEEISAGSKVQYLSDDEDTSLYDTIVSQDCHGVKLVKNPRKPNSLPHTTERKKKLLLTTDLFSGNLLDDDLKSLSDHDLDELLTPSVDDDLENSILEQLNLSDDDEVESIQELSAREEREESRKWKICLVNGTEKRIDMKVIEPYKRVLSHGGYLSADCHNAIIVFSACFLPHHSRADYHYVMDNLFFYVLYTLDQLITEDYVLVYLHGATSRHNMPTFSWLKRCYQMIDRKLKKNLKQLYLVHATFWLKTIILMSKPFISAKFSKKIQFIMSLTELGEKLPIEDASIPEKVKQYDKIKLSMSSSQQH